jgi:hypothetical protein
VTGRPLGGFAPPRRTGEFRIELVKVERRALPASLFEIPPGYRETSAFRVSAQSAERERDAERDEALLLRQMEHCRPTRGRSSRD